MTAGAVSFAAAKTAEAILAPSSLLLGLAVAGFLLRRRPLGVALLAASLATQCAIALLPLDSWALAPLENRFPACRTLPPGLAGAIVLGGAVDQAVAASRGQPTLNEAAGRMTELTRLARLLPPAATLAFAGGSGRVLDGRLTEADVARAFWAEQGVARPITYEKRSRTTWENARNLAALLRPAAGELWLLDTSAVHMPRAVAAFRAAGFRVVADPVAYQTAPTLAAELEPGFSERLGRLDEAAHEWGGLLAYRLMGRTRELLPSARQGRCP